MKLKELITELLDYPLDIHIEDNLNNITPLRNLMKSQIKLGFRCDKCSKPSHAGQYGKGFPQPCFWCKGEYVYPGHERAEKCLEYDQMDTTYGDYRPVLA